jgi:hypothetical protein
MFHSEGEGGFFYKWIIPFSLAFCIGCENTGKYKYDIGYINPETALGDRNFKTCDGTIYQYYNSGSEAGYKFGKKALRDSIKSKYVRASDESGYLTIRFIINCKGIAGRYEIVENDLELRPKAFAMQLKDHLLNITSELKEWRPLLLGTNARDSYMYITFKIKNGHITEILP